MSTIDDPTGVVRSSKDKLVLSQWFVLGFAAFTVTMLFVISVNNHNLTFHLKYNPWAILSLFSVVGNIVAFYFVNRLKAKGDEFIWLSIFIACLEIWAVSEFFQRVSSSPQTSLFWDSASGLGATSMASAFYLFTLSYTRPSQPRHLLTIVALYITPLFLILVDLSTSLFTRFSSGSIIYEPWGPDLVRGPYYGILTGWIVGLFIISLCVLIKYQSQIIHPILKRQARLFIATLSVTLIVGAVTDAILPTLHMEIVPPMAVLLSTSMAIAITYGIVKYRLLSFNLMSIASNILETMDEAVIGIDADFRITYVNKGAENMLGYSAKEFSELKLDKFLGDAWSNKTRRQALLAPLKSQRYSRFNDLDLHTAKRKVLKAKLSLSEVVGEGRLEGYLLVFTDITEISKAKEIIEATVVERTKELNEVQSQLTASISSLPFGFAVIDKEDEIIFSNSLFGRILNENISPDKLASKEALRLIDEKYKPYIDILDCVNKAQSKKHPTERNIAVGPCYYRFFFMPILSKHHEKEVVLGTVLLVEDVTEAKTIERSRDEFFSIASHELRTPLTAIRGNTSMMLKYYQEQLKDPGLHSMVDDIHDASLRLIDIVNDFLDVSRLEMGKFIFDNKPTDLYKLIQETLREFDVSGSRKKIDLKFVPLEGEEPWAVTDADRVRQVIINLVGNSLKATNEGSITVAIETHFKHLHIKVTDTGIGIPAQSQHLLFHKFQQASNSILTRDNTQSTGLGLYISKLIAEGMHGRLYLEKSEVNKGSTFVLELPKASAADIKSALRVN